VNNNRATTKRIADLLLRAAAELLVFTVALRLSLPSRL